MQSGMHGIIRDPFGSGSMSFFSTLVYMTQQVKKKNIYICYLISFLIIYHIIYETTVVVGTKYYNTCQSDLSKSPFQV